MPFMCGFRKFYFIKQAITKSLGKGNIVITILLDLENAFDTLITFEDVVCSL